MNKSSVFLGRQKELEQLRALHAMRRHVLIVGGEGIGKTALLHHVREFSSILICDDNSSLRRICDSLEQQLGCGHYGLNVIERKNRLLIDLERRGEPVVFDHVVHAAPRVASSGISVRRFQSGSHAARIGRMTSDTSGPSFTNSRASNSSHWAKSRR